MANLFNLDYLSHDEQQFVTEMLERNKDAVSTHEFDLGHVKGHKHAIELIDKNFPTTVAKNTTRHVGRSSSTLVQLSRG